jgi:hypothetical protein
MKYLALLALLFMATASRLRVPVDEKLAMIDSTTYGKTLLDTI